MAAAVAYPREGGHERVRHPPSEVINRIDVSDPQEDLAREQARMAESGAGLHVVNSEGVGHTRTQSANAVPRRQDFSNEKVSRRDTRLGDYILGQTIGEGEFGKVKMGWKQQGGVQVAIKLIRREKLDNSARLAKVYREINILRELDHPNIVRLHEMVETERTIGIVLEYASGGELFDFILHERYLKDGSARRLFAQLVSGIGYLHKKGIIHRDLKLENLLLDRNNNIIITDFGFANTFDPTDELDERIESKLHRRSFVKKHNLEAVGSNGFRRGDLMATSCGSPCYAAPELVISEGIYTGRKVDVWSCGVILYAMLAGYLPFDDDPANPDGDNINLLYRYISTAPLVFPEHVTPHARDLLRRILVPDPRKRADLFEVARHSWLSDYAHVVEFITSTTTLPIDLSRAAVSSDGQYAPPLARSSSVREPTKFSPVGGLISKQGKVTLSPESELEKTKSQVTPKETKRRTVQVEYLPPQSQTARGDRPTSARGAAVDEGVAPPPPPKPTSRPVRDVPRSISDSTAFTVGQPVSAQSSLPGSRLPSRGSYGQPVAATVATTNAQGRFAQPKPGSSSGGYVISAPIPQSEGITNGRFPGNAAPEKLPAGRQRGHARSHTLSDLGQKIFGRTPSARRAPELRPKADRTYPPSSMRPIDQDAMPRPSADSHNSFRTDTQGKRSSRRFSWIPRFGASSREGTPPQTADPSNAPVYSQGVDGTAETTTATTVQPYAVEESKIYTYDQVRYPPRAPPSQPVSTSQTPPPASQHTASSPPYSRKEKTVAWDTDQWNSNRRFSKGGPAQRVMDFFRGRRQERSGIA